MKKNFLVSLFFTIALFLFSKVCAQENINSREIFVEAESYFLFEEYKDALPLYQKIILAEPDNYNVLYKIGICYLNDPYQEEKSIKYLSEASKHITDNYKTNSYKEKLAPPEANFYLGQAFRISGQLDKAIESFTTFKQNVNQDLFDIDVVNDEIASCEKAKKMKSDPVYFHKDNIGSKINSRFADDNPVLSGDGKTFVFNRSLQFYDAVFISTKDKSGNWSDPVNLTPDLGLDGSSYVTGISFNGDEIFVYRSDNYDGNLYSSKLSNGKWQKLNKLNDQINTRYWESRASTSPDGKFLYFTSNREGGYGGLDIYKAPRISGNQWGTPVNLGPVVNSPYNEDAPIISPDGTKLFFTSLGHRGMGGYDLFVSEKLADGTWAKPVNMGYPVNTTDDDLSFCPVAFNNNATGIYSSYDPKSTTGLKDIYWVQVYNQALPRSFTLKGKVNTPSPDLLKNSNIKISLVDNNTGKIVQQVSTDESGNFTLKPTQGSYQLLVEGDGIKPVSIPVELSLTQENSLVELPVINTQSASKDQESQVIPISQLPKLEIPGGNYIMADTSPVTINLLVDKGSNLSIENYYGGELKSKEEYLVSKEKFAYVFAPQPGENRILFTVRDKNGNTNQKEVTVYYKPKHEEPVASVEPKKVVTSLSDAAQIAKGKLKDYLLSLDTLSYDTYLDLYNMLLKNAAANGYTQQDINDLFAILLTQRTKNDFLYYAKKVDKLEPVCSNDSIIQSSNIPLAIVQKNKIVSPDEKTTINLGLIDVVPFSGKTPKELSYILSFVDKPYTGPTDISLTASEPKLEYLIKDVGDTNASTSIELSSTTQELDQFYNNLLMSTDNEFKKVLHSINFDSVGIHNSIDLVKHLFKLSMDGKISVENLIRNLEKARQEERMNLNIFKDALAVAATGGLKLKIQEISIDNDNIYRFTDIIELLLRNSQTSGYGRTEVYDLLLDMIGIKNAEDFANEMQKYARGDLKKILGETNKKQFSTPLELIQYLLSQTENFDYTDSDINNLLLRMLLEKGLGEWQNLDKSAGGGFFKNHQLLAYIILANILLILLLIFLWRRKKKKQQQQKQE